MATTDSNTIATRPADGSAPPATGQAGRIDAPRAPWLRRAPAFVRAHVPLVMSIAAVVLIVAAQVVEDLADVAGLQMAPPTFIRERWTVIAVAIYALAIVGILRREARESIDALRPVIGCDNDRFEAYRRRMVGFGLTVELGLLAASAIVVILLFPVLGQALPIADSASRDALMPSTPGVAILSLVGWTAFGWSGLRLVVSTVIVARTLGRLTREPVTVRVFDPTDLLPFGNIALTAALAPAGLIAIFLLGLGAPQTPLGWAVLFLATGTSLLALILPLRGIHGQMRRAKDEALSGLNRQLSDVHQVVETNEPAPGSGAAAELNNRTAMLVSLRAVVTQMPTWPFRDTVAFGRAVLIASAPVIYAALNGLVDAFVVKRIAP